MSVVQQNNSAVQQEARVLQEILQEAATVVVGQDRLLNRIVIALLAGGHILIEGVPGLAKTLAVKTLAATIQARFRRVQFTPDLLPSDLIGTQIYNTGTGEFTPRLGPIFANLVLADEINRAPAKVQSALLEAMEERQVTIGEQTFPLPDPFMVLATQNPIEHEGTYILPEAQLDRFLLKVIVGYPSRDDEHLIMDRMTSDHIPTARPVVETRTLLHAREVVTGLYVDERIKNYVLDIVGATRDPAGSGLKDLRPWIEMGASPRASVFLLRAAKAHAFIRGRSYITPDDVKLIAPDVLRHRLLLTFEAQAESIDAGQIVDQILSRIAVP